MSKYIYPVITISGSMKYFEAMVETARALSSCENIVLLPFKDVRDEDGMTTETKETLADMHEQRIDMCDILYVCNFDNYIGEATQKEIDYAKQLNKEIVYLEPPSQKG